MKIDVIGLAAMGKWLRSVASPGCACLLAQLGARRDVARRHGKLAGELQAATDPARLRANDNLLPQLVEPCSGPVDILAAVVDGRPVLPDLPDGDDGPPDSQKLPDPADAFVQLRA